MDIATVIGLIGGVILVLAAIVTGSSPSTFVNIPSLLVVVGGSVATSFIRFSMKDVINTIAVAMKAFLVKMQAAEEMIEQMVSYAKTAKKEGLIALEKEKPADKFTAKALRYLADGFDEGLIREILNKDIQITVQRHTIGQNVFKSLGGAAPAFGMIGTLIGLVQMLTSMSDPSSIGPSMAVALLTTLYGAMMANIVCLPIADKLALRCEQEQSSRNMILEAAIGISQGTSPMVLEETLKIYLSPKQRDSAEAEDQKEPSKK
jgi:chemotaxis protein MotA